MAGARMEGFVFWIWLEVGTLASIFRCAVSPAAFEMLTIAGSVNEAGGGGEIGIQRNLAPRNDAGAGHVERAGEVSHGRMRERAGDVVLVHELEPGVVADGRRHQCAA